MGEVACGGQRKMKVGKKGEGKQRSIPWVEKERDERVTRFIQV